MSKKAKLEVVSTRAPRPSRYGPSQVVYDVIDANGGSATAKQVHELVPAAVDTNRVFTVEQIEAAFSNGVYRGYLTFNDTTSSYQIAPVSYYAARKSVVSEMEREARERRKEDGAVSRLDGSAARCERIIWRRITARIDLLPVPHSRATGGGDRDP